MERLREGCRLVFQIGDTALHYGIGTSEGCITLNEYEADVFARVLAKRADDGAKWAAEQAEKIAGYADMVELGMIAINKGMKVAGEVMEHGIQPFFLRKPDGDSGGDR